MLDFYKSELTDVEVAIHLITGCADNETFLGYADGMMFVGESLEDRPSPRPSSDAAARPLGCVEPDATNSGAESDTGVNVNEYRRIGDDVGSNSSSPEHQRPP